MSMNNAAFTITIEYYYFIILQAETCPSIIDLVVTFEDRYLQFPTAVITLSFLPFFLSFFQFFLPPSFIHILVIYTVHKYDSLSLSA